MESFFQRRRIADRSVRKLAEKLPVNLSESDDTTVDKLESKLPDPQPSEQRDDDDIDVNPRKWPRWKKLVATLIVTAISFVVQYASAVDSAAAERIQEEFGVSAVAECLATGLYKNNSQLMNAERA